MEVSQNGWFLIKHSNKMNDLGYAMVPLFRKPPNESSENQITLIFLTTVVKVEKQDKITTPAVASHF
jgi:hypothetical protein